MFFLIGSWSLSLYNFLLAFVICGGVIIIGEVVSTLTKAWVPSVFVSAVLLLLGYWTILPHDLVKDSFLIPFGATLCIYLLITHLGTIISLKQLMQQWRTVTVCLAGLLGALPRTLLRLSLWTGHSSSRVFRRSQAALRRQR